VTLVYPAEADISQGRISVLTPVGTALIGLRSGGSITWETPAGEARQLTVLAVRDSHPACLWSAEHDRALWTRPRTLL